MRHFLGKVWLKVYDMHQLENRLENFSLRKWATLRLVPKSKVLHQPSEGKVIRFNIEPELNFSGGQLFGKKAKLWRTPLHAQMFLFNLWRAQTLEICTDICKIEKMFGEHDRPSLRGWKLDADRRSSHEKREFNASPFFCINVVLKFCDIFQHRIHAISLFPAKVNVWRKKTSAT